MSFPEICREVVPQTIIQRESARNLPRVLRIQSQLSLSHPGTCWIGHLYLIDLAEQETGVAKPNIGAIHRRVLEGLPRFCGGEGVHAIGVSINDRRIALGAEFRAVFVTMIVFD